MDILVALVLYIVLGVLGSGTYILALKLWGEPLEVYRRLILGAVGGFLVFLLVLGRLVQAFLTWIATFFGGEVLVPVDSPIGFLMAFSIGGYWCVDFISALMNRFKPSTLGSETLPAYKSSFTGEEQIKEIEKGTDLGKMFLNAQRSLMVYQYEKAGIKEYTLSDEVVLNALKERVKAGKEEPIFRFR